MTRSHQIGETEMALGVFVDARLCLMPGGCQTLPQPQNFPTLNSNPYTLNSKPHTFNSEPYTLNPKSDTLNSEPYTLTLTGTTHGTHTTSDFSSGRCYLNPEPAASSLLSNLGICDTKVYEP